MTIRKTLLASGLAGLTLLATAATAFAAPAVATGNVNVRSGPGTGYGVVDTLRRGETVDVQQCRGSWCYVQKRGPDGWVSSNYLSRGGGWNDDDWNGGYNPPPRPRPPVYDPPPRPPHWNPRPPRPPHWNNPRPQPYPVYPSNPGASFCFNGPNGYFCAGN
ncbi:SH3 domain-containing protein [Devosia aurantiaca]|uniref:SH3 domain-containing protein n=1 Tax=Devosia aurantiaca TaxID=2714858 RepID=A0A6M1SV24_9HYPH|nr:SH3 domain-containing protein [Devosia aurantiaca]NGP18233.1 SH3 domain-containing protein [Devosia aurantiaca]